MDISGPYGKGGALMLCEMHWTSESEPFASSCLGRGPEPLLPFFREVLKNTTETQPERASPGGSPEPPWPPPSSGLGRPPQKQTTDKHTPPSPPPSRRVELVGGMGIGALLNVLEPPGP